MESKQNEVCYLQERRQVKVMDSEERGGGSGYKDTDLVDRVVGRVEGPIFLERAR